jgi:AcrR family transcriptional regulator
MQLGATSSGATMLVDSTGGLAVPKQEAPTETPKKFRRQPGVGRDLILAAAHDVFSEHGYARATTREIAERAGVAEPLLFRSFGSKANLFNEVVFGPMHAFMLEWEKFDAEAGDEYDVEALAKRFVAGFYDLLRANRGLMISYFATQVFEPEVIAEPGDVPTFLEVIGLMDRATEMRTRTDKPSGRRTKATAKSRVHERINIGSVIAAALFDDLLFAAIPTRPTRNQVVNELARIATVSLPSASS